MSIEQELEEKAMMAELSGIPLVVDEPSPAAEPVPEPEPTPETEAVPERVELVAGYTKEDFDSLMASTAEISKLKKALDTANGTYGQRLQALTDEISTLRSTKPAAVKPTFSKLNEEYPDIARLIAEDLQELPVAEQSQVDITEYERRLDEKIAKFERKVAEEKLRSVHPDYQDIATWSAKPGEPIIFSDMKFGNWLAQQDEESQQIILAGSDPEALSKVISNYKDSIKVDTPVDVIKAAVQPRGVKSTSIGKSDEELEEEAMRAELAKGFY